MSRYIINKKISLLKSSSCTYFKQQQEQLITPLEENNEYNEQLKIHNEDKYLILQKDNIIEQTAANSIIEQTADNSTIEQTADNSIIEQTAANSTIEQTADNSTIEQTADNSTIEQTADNSIIEQTSANTFEQTADNSTIEQIAANSTIEQIDDNKIKQMIYNNKIRRLANFKQTKQHVDSINNTNRLIEQAKQQMKIKQSREMNGSMNGSLNGSQIISTSNDLDNLKVITEQLNKTNESYLIPTINDLDNLKASVKQCEEEPNILKFIKLDDFLYDMVIHNIDKTTNKTNDKTNDKTNNNLLEYVPMNKTMDYINANFSLDRHRKTSIENNVLVHPNSIEIDPHFYAYSNGISLDINSKDILCDICNNGIKNGYIYSHKQIDNFFGIQLKYYLYNNKILFYYNENYYDVKDLVDKIYAINYNQLINNIEIIENNIEDVYNVLCCVFIGNYDIGLKILEKISKMKDLVFCFIIKDIEIYKRLLNKLGQLPNSIIFLCRELGTDIIPTLQAIKFILNNYDIKYIYKIHTKSNAGILDEVVDYLVNNTTEDLINMIDHNKSNCSGHPKYLLKVNNDAHNRSGYQIYAKHIDMSKYFIANTIFFTESSTCSQVLNFIKNNDFRSFFINNMYDNNLVNFHHSPAHFLERLFGILVIN